MTNEAHLDMILQQKLFYSIKYFKILQKIQIFFHITPQPLSRNPRIFQQLLERFSRTVAKVNLIIKKFIVMRKSQDIKEIKNVQVIEILTDMKNIKTFFCWMLYWLSLPVIMEVEFCWRFQFLCLSSWDQLKYFTGIFWIFISFFVFSVDLFFVIWVKKV